MVVTQVMFASIRGPDSAWSKLGADIDGEATYDSIRLVCLTFSRWSDGCDWCASRTTAMVVDSGHVRIYSWTGSSWSKLGADIDGEAT